jgi:hypothetical protein
MPIVVSHDVNPGLYGQAATLYGTQAQKQQQDALDWEKKVYANKAWNQWADNINAQQAEEEQQKYNRALKEKEMEMNQAKLDMASDKQKNEIQALENAKIKIMNSPYHTDEEKYLGMADIDARLGGILNTESIMGPYNNRQKFSMQEERLNAREKEFEKKLEEQKNKETARIVADQIKQNQAQGIPTVEAVSMAKSDAPVIKQAIDESTQSILNQGKNLKLNKQVEQGGNQAFSDNDFVDITYNGKVKKVPKEWAKEKGYLK